MSCLSFKRRWADDRCRFGWCARVGIRARGDDRAADRVGAEDDLRAEHANGWERRPAQQNQAAEKIEVFSCISSARMIAGEPELKFCRQA
jgi:hypothetical protein